MNSPKVTVIVPIYNTAAFLGDCLESLSAQSMQEFEAILVDDGSEDKSGDICDQYAEKDARFKVIHQKNQGVSAARNSALQLATGEFIFFLDSDDVLPSDALHTLLAKKSDLTIGSMEEITETGQPNGIRKLIPNYKLTSEEMLWALFDERRYGYQGYLCNKLYRNSLIKENKICFHPGICYNEDRLFLTEYLMPCKQIQMISPVVYRYRQRDNGTVGQLKVCFKSKMLTELDAFEEAKKRLLEHDQALYIFICRLVFEKSLYWLQCIPSAYCEEKIKVRNIMRENMIACVKSSEYSVKEKIKMIVHAVLER